MLKDRCISNTDIHPAAECECHLLLPSNCDLRHQVAPVIGAEFRDNFRQVFHFRDELSNLSVTALRL